MMIANITSIEVNATVEPITDTPSASTAKTAEDTPYRKMIKILARDGAAVYASAGERSLKLGHKVKIKARERADSMQDKHTAKTLGLMLVDVREEIVVLLPIASDSIRLLDWLRAAVLQDRVRDALGDDSADSLTYADLDRLAKAGALTWDGSTVDGSLADGWAHVINYAVATRAKNTFSGTEFIGHINMNVARLADLGKTGVTSAQVNAGIAEESAKKKGAAFTSAVKAIGKSIDTGTSASDLYSAVNTAARIRGVASAAAFSVATCNAADCERLADDLFRAGKYAEMQVLGMRIAAIMRENSKPSPRLAITA